VSFADLGDWLSTWSQAGSIGYLKRLSGNDTLANESHQAGPYIPKDLLFELLPSLKDATVLNPRVEFECYVDSHGEHRKVTAIWYNNKHHGGTRDEARVTNWGGASSALLDPDSTGALAVFLFSPRISGQPPVLHIWVCRQPAEEELVEGQVSPVAPGQPLMWRPGVESTATAPALRSLSPHAHTCRMTPAQMPPGWLAAFPTGADIVRKVCELRPAGQTRPDERLVGRRDCEFEVFQSVEEAIEGTVITHGFHSVADFLTHAQRILQRRKSRSGRSLELQTRAILIEEGMVDGRDFSHQPESEDGKRPDFLFPSAQAYRDHSFPASKLRLLAAKTTCKDRWRQVISEADRIPVKHLLTLQEGVSVGQYAEMSDAGIKLVVPTPLMRHYPKTVQPELMSVETFILSLQQLQSIR
jgi:hypothetical protein